MSVHSCMPCNPVPRTRRPSNHRRSVHKVSAAFNLHTNKRRRATITNKQTTVVERLVLQVGQCVMLTALQGAGPIGPRVPSATACVPDILAAPGWLGVRSLAS